MHKYRVKHNGATYYYWVDRCDDAAAKLGRRKVYGNCRIGDLRLDVYDADTRGKRWAEYTDQWSGKRVSVERADLY